MASEKNNGSDLVGYGRPPKDCQFKPGRSGNPAGRPKGVRNFKTDLQEELGEMIAFREGNHEIAISKQRALIKRIVASALAGDTRAIMALMTFCTRELGNIGEAEADPEDGHIIAAISKAQRSTKKVAAKGTAPIENLNTRDGGSHEG